MANFEQLSVEDALERSIRNAKHLSAVHSAHVAAARTLARRIDDLGESGFVDENGKLDNVSLPSFLKYLDALGMSVSPPPSGKAAAVQSRPRDQLAEMRQKLKSG